MRPASTTQPATATTLESVAAQVLECARRAGADQAEACVESTRGFSVRVRSGAIETLTQSATRGIGLRVIIGGAVGFVSSTDLAPGAVGVTTRDSATVIANSHGLVRAWDATALSLFSVALADDRDGKQQSGGYGVSKRSLAALPPVEAVAAEAGRRAVARIGARPVPSARVPVVMHPDAAAAWLSEIYHAFSGEAVLKQSSWLTGKLGQAIAAPRVTIVDDGRLRGGVGSEPYDGEGVPTRRNTLVDLGRLAMFTYDTYTARRAGTRSTGSATRSYSSVPGVGHHNLFIEAGDENPAAILARVDRGFYMDDQGSFGFNEVTGDYSFQVQGFWIDKGKKVFPVEGVTVASTSLEMLGNIAAVGNDLAFDDHVSSPTLLIAEMTVSGAG